ncbi:MAG TPA: amidohydrolase family protein [Thermoanaerobaculia bacterium]|nr:amidohydrolase family protein [Thermoanaerobaculia bacterium]
MPRFNRVRTALAALVLLAPAAAPSPAQQSFDERGADRRAYALTGARVLVAPGKAIDGAVVIVRGGVIESVGPAGTAIPADAERIDLSGRVVHAAFIDANVSTDRLAGKPRRKPRDDGEKPSPPPARAAGPSAHPVSAVRAEDRVVDALSVKDDVAEAYRRMGFAVVDAAPSAGVLRGRGAVVSLSDGAPATRVLVPSGGQFVSLEPMEGADREYPVSIMGTVAVARQAFLDAKWARDAEAAYAGHPAGRARPRVYAASEALLPAAEGRETVVFETNDALALLRAASVASEMKLKARYVGGGDAYRLSDDVAAVKPDLVLRVDYPRPVKVDREEEWLDVPLSKLRAFDRAPSNPRWLRDAGLEFSLTTDGLDDATEFPARVREAIARGLSRQDALAALTTIPARQLGLADRLGTLEAGRIANIAVETGEPFEAGSRVAEVWIDGRRIEIPEPGKPERKDSLKKDAASSSPAPDVRPVSARWAGPLAAPQAVVVRGATVWTQTDAGILENADLLVVGGKVVAAGKGLAAPAGAVEIDGKGLHVTPGIIDAHSHTAIDGDVNEGSHNVTAEVRIQDVLDPFSVSIERELAGGTTAANVLHGSANAIGGQNQIVKWRLGSGPKGLVFEGAPAGIKFALGENPKQSNWRSPKPRYPASRMGVAELIRERFAAARDYRARQEEYRRAAAVKGATPIPPEPDLQLEAIAEILEGKRQIHCHSYRKDEILQMIRSAEEFGVKIATFQHALEGYKVADEIAKHGAGASGFSDWWAYKYEVWDAIPYAFPLMRERGVVVSFNSDSDELARRLNLEAAKAVKYGNVAPADALAFVTSNSAKQLGIDNRVGSLAAGKDGDFVIWSGDPLSSETVALQTWIDGKKYFDRDAERASRPALEKERADLVAKAKASLDKDSGGEKKDEKPDKPAAAPTPKPAARGAR